jgi:hypothetical protein
MTSRAEHRPAQTAVSAGKTGWRQQWIGHWISAVAVIHTLFALVVFGHVFVDIIERGVINTVGSDPMTAAAVWFLLFGVALWLLGVAVAGLQRAAQPIPATLGWGLFALCALGVLLMPASGFWLAFPPAIGMLLKKRPPAAV